MKNSIIARFFCLLFLFSACFYQVTLGQTESGQITGTVKDPNGAAVANATVTARSTSTGFSRTATTNESGEYALLNLQPSTYEITSTNAGFAEFKTTREVSVGGRISVEIVLSVAGSQATVDVIATDGEAVAEVNTTDQTISEVVSNKQITELPTISRNPYEFIETVGNVSEGDNSGRGVGVAINGQRSASTSILINGGENVDTFRATPGQRIPIDSVQEYRVVTGTFTAEYGRATGGVVNLVTRSGRNNFFGSAYIFNRNSDFSSAGFDANARITAQDRANGVEPRQFFNRNNYGFAVGGPIFKDKLLFFTNTEWLKIRSTASNTVFVPSAADIAGAAPATRNFFSAYQLNAQRTGVTATLRGTPPNPNDPNSVGRPLVFDEVRYSVPADTGAGDPQDSVYASNRIDWNVNDKLQIYGVYSFDFGDLLEGAVSSSPYAGFSTSQLDRNHNLTLNGTYQFTSNLIGVTRFTYNYLKNEQPLGEQPEGPTLYLKTSANNIGGIPIGFPGYLPFNPGSAIPFGGPQKLSTISQELTWTVGDHILKGGAQYYSIRDNRAFGAFQNSVQTLGSNNATAVDNFFNGVLFQYQGAINPQGRFPGQTVTLPVSAPDFSRQNRYQELAFYVTDAWKWFPNFTANIGLRYEYYGPQRNRDRNLDSNFYFGSGNSLQERIRNGSVQIAPNSPVGDLYQKDNNNFAPSVGFAYDVEGNGRSAIRAGYALRYERNFGNVTFNVIQNPPNYAVISVTSADIGGAPIPITTSNAGPLAGSTGSVVLPRVSLRHVREDIVNAYSHQWSASYSRQLGGNLTGSFEYTGTKGVNLYSIENINRFGSAPLYLGTVPQFPGLPPNSAQRLNPQYGAINSRGNNGFSNYNGVTFSLESNNLFNTGLLFTSRYTYASSKDNLSTTFSELGNNFNLGVLDPFNAGLDYGPADFDIRHRFVTNFVWDIPTDKYISNSIARAIFGGFTLSSIINVRSGLPFSVFDCEDAVEVCKRLIPNGSLTFENAGGDFANAGTNRFTYISLAGQTPVVLTPTANNPFPGNNGPFPENMTRRNAFRGPNFWNVDAALIKNIRFTERFRLQLRVDADNIFNRANYFVNAGETDISFTDEITVSKDGRRQIQFGARFIF